MKNPEVDLFEEWFFRDLEKGFSADIACCNSCHDNFLNIWPYADSADDYRFQKSGIDLNTFYEGSCLRHEYTKADFDRLICQLRCPRCGSPLDGVVWPYNFPFDLPEDLEDTIKNVATLARKTPFLLLEHEFCKRILSAIQALAENLQWQQFNQHLFRGRSEENGFVKKHIQEFNFPPSIVVQEGRFNHAGNPVLYFGSDIETCHAELRKVPSLIIELKIRKKLRVLDLIDPYNQEQFTFHHAELMNCLVYSSLMSARHDADGLEKPHYVVSRFVADCARACSIDAIRYPSTQRTGKNFNLVIINSEYSLEKISQIVQFHRIGGV